MNKKEAVGFKGKFMTRAEKVLEILGEDLFLKAEAYYYESFSTPESISNFIMFLNEPSLFGEEPISYAFIWSGTEEGYNFWEKINAKTKRRLKR